MKSSGNSTGSDWVERTHCKHRGEGIKPFARTWGISCVQFGWCKDKTIPVPKAFTLTHTELALAGRPGKEKYCLLITEKQMAPQGTFFWVAPSSTKVLTAQSPPPPSRTNFSRSLQTTITEMLKLPSYRTKPYHLLQVFYVKNNQCVEKQALKASSDLNQIQMRSLWRSPEEWVNGDIPKLQSASICVGPSAFFFFLNKINGVCCR